MTLALPVTSRAPRVAVVFKKSVYEMYVEDGGSDRVARLIEEGDPSVARIRPAHDSHRAAVDHTRETLESLGAEATFHYRGTLDNVDKADLVVTLGGDGTLLWASHLVGVDRPMLAINTSPQSSIGYFCAGTRDNLTEILQDALRGNLDPTVLNRMQVTVDGKVLSNRVLNDVLFCHSCPAATSRYIVRHGDLEEEQRSSGVWVGPAAGSTAAQRSSGGSVLPLRSERLQFVVREPYEPAGVGYRLAKGFIEPGSELLVRSKMSSACLYVDGPHREFRVDWGSVLRLTRSDEPFTLLGLRGDFHGP